MQIQDRTRPESRLFDPDGRIHPAGRATRMPPEPSAPVTGQTLTGTSQSTVPGQSINGTQATNIVAWTANLTVSLNGQNVAIVAQPPQSGPLVSGTAPAKVARDLWTEAMQRLPEKARAILKSLSPPTPTGVHPRQVDIDQLLSLVKSKRDECDRKRWKFKINGQQIILRDVAEKVVGWLNKFKQIGQMTASIDPLHAGPVWAGMAAADTEQMAILLSSAEVVTCQVGRCGIYEFLYLRDGEKSRATDHLFSSLLAIYTEILTFLATAIGHYNRNTFTRALSATFGVGTVFSFAQKCQCLAEGVEVDASNCERMHTHQFGDKLERSLSSVEQLRLILEAPVVRTDERVAELWKRSGASRQSQILRWISDVPYERLHHAAKEVRTPDTGTWLLNHRSYIEWRASSASTFLWLHGIPGAGKTVLVTSVIDDILDTLSVQPNDEAFAYFYCKRNEKGRDDAASILRSFVRQLSVDRTGDAMQTSMLEFYALKEKTGFSSDQLEVDECQDRLLEYMTIYPQTTLVLDALDECNADTQRALIDVLDDLVDRSGSIVKVFISSRLTEEINYRFESGPNIGIQATDNHEDIALFVTASLREYNATHRRQLSQRVQQKIMATILAKSQGMFQWAALQIGQLLRLNRERDIIERLGKLPVGLTKAYDEIHDQIRQQPGSAFMIAERTFRWIIGAGQELKAEALIGLVCQEPDDHAIRQPDPDVDISFVLNACKNLVVYDAELDTCRLSHLSVEEYLESCGYSRNLCNEFAAYSCLTLLTSDLYYTADGFPMFRAEASYFDERSSSGSDDEATWEDLYPSSRKRHANAVLTKRSNSLVVLANASSNTISARACLEYAVWHWFEHVRDCEEADSSRRLTMLLIKFLGSPTHSSPEYLRWFSWLPARASTGAFMSEDEAGLTRIDLTPPRPASLCMVYFGLYHTIWPFWDEAFLDVSQRGIRGETLLMIGARRGHLALCRRLIDLGVNVNDQIVDPSMGYIDGVTALHVATYYRSMEVIRLLLDSKANTNLVSSNHGTPLQIIIETFGTSLTATEEDDAIILRWLMDAEDCDVNAIGGRFGTTLLGATYHGRLEIVNALLAQGVDINVQHESRGTALWAADQLDESEIAVLLREAGAIEYEEDDLFQRPPSTGVVRIPVREVREHSESYLIEIKGLKNGDGERSDVEMSILSHDHA